MDTAPVEPDAKAPSNDAQRHARPDGSLPGSEDSSPSNSENQAAAASDPPKQPCDEGDNAGKSDGADAVSPPKDEPKPLNASEETVEGEAVFGDVARGVVKNFLNAKKDAFGSAENVLSGHFPAAGDNNFYFTSDPRQAPPPPDQRADEAKSLLDLTGEFTPHKSDLSWLDTTEIDNYYQVLKTDRLLFITSPDRTIARNAAWGIIEKMNLAESKQRRLLDFESLSERNSIPNLSNLRKPDHKQNGSNEHSDIAIVIDAVNANVAAKDFLRSFPIDTRDATLYALEQNRAFMLYLINSTDLKARLKTEVGDQTYYDDLKLSEWNLPFLRSLLKPRFPDNYLELETKIRQRADWSQTDRGLFWRVKDLINKNLLLQSLDAPPVAPDGQTAARIFTGNEPIQDTVAYVAAFFTDLNPREFQRVVAVLLGERTRTITVSALKQNEDGTAQEVKVQQEKRLVAIWQESMDEVNRRCSLVTAPAPDGTRIVDFADQRTRAQLRQYIEDDHGFFVTGQFARLFDAALLFDPSARIGESMVSLTAAVVASDPDHYVQQLVAVIEKLETASGDSNGESASAEPLFTMLAGVDPSQANNHLYQRIVALIRALLDDPTRKGVVNSFIEQLMRRKLFGPVLKIVRRLKSARGFDEAHWLKQLFERGDSLTGGFTLVYLYGYFRSLGPRIYQLLTALDSWIPKQPLSEIPSTAASEALRLLLVHCFDTTASLDRRYYGTSPSQHPLFAFRDRETAERSLKLLLRWLLHPWMNTVFADENEFEGVEALVSTLVFKWSQILIGRSASGNADDKAALAAALSATDTQVILISQLVARADINQRTVMVADWQRSSRKLMNQIQRAPYVSELRNDLIWERNLLESLIRQFRSSASPNTSSGNGA